MRQHDGRREAEMRRTIIILCSLIVMLSGTKALFSQGDVTNLITSYKSDLGLYEFESYAAREVVLLPKKEHKEVIEFTVFAGRKYKIIFCTAGLNEQLAINIYDKPEGNKYRRKVYDNSDVVENKTSSFEPKKIGTYYIEYDVPASGTDRKKAGKLVLLIGLLENGEY